MADRDDGLIRVSVVVAAYNARAFLARAIESVLTQTEPSFELIVVDDVSQDDTAALVLDYARRDGRVRLIRAEENGGPGFARNLALAEARGDWVALLDADDAFLPARLERLLSIAELEGADVVSDNLLLRDPVTGDIRGKMFPPTWFREALLVLTGPAFVAGNMGDADHPARLAYGFMKPVVRRQFLIDRALNYRTSRFAEDYILYLELLCCGARWLVTPEAYYEYDVRSDSLSAKVRGADKAAVMAAERTVMSSPAVQSQPELRDLVQRHLKSTELSLAWDRFCEALKAGKLSSALAVALSDGSTAMHLGRQALAHLWRMSRSRAQWAITRAPG